MACRRCGRPVQSDLCDTCSFEVGDARVWTDHDEVYECPGCGGETSGEGVLCYNCRGDDGE